MTSPSDHTVGNVDADSLSPPDLKSSSNISLPFAWITGSRKQRSACITKSFKNFNSFEKHLNKQKLMIFVAEISFLKKLVLVGMTINCIEPIF